MRGRRVVPARVVAAGLVAVVSLAVPVPGPAAATASAPADARVVLTKISPPAELPPGSRFGHAVAALGDVNGDTVADVAVSAPVAGRVLVFSGADRSILRTITDQGPPPPDGTAMFGAALSPVADMDGDGVDDLIVGSPIMMGSVTDISQCDIPDPDGGDTAGCRGRVSVYSAATGAELLALVPGGFASRGFGFAVTPIGDVSGDGIVDIGVGHPISAGGAVLAHSGADGSELWFSVPCCPQANAFGAFVSTVADQDGDGRSEVLASAPLHRYDRRAGHGQVFVLSGATGDILRTHEHPAGDWFGAGLGTVGDLDRDGVPDYAIGECGSHRLHLFSGDDGAAMRTMSVPEAVGYLPADAGDQDADGRPDLWVAAPGADGQVLLLDAAGEVLMRAPDPTRDHLESGCAAMPSFGTALARSADIGGDVADDAVVGDPDERGPGGAVGAAWILTLRTIADALEPTRADEPPPAVHDWEHEHLRCPADIRHARMDPHATCETVFADGIGAAGAEESWTLSLDDLSLHDGGDVDRFRFRLPDPGRTDGGGHADIAPGPGNEPLPECGTMSRTDIGGARVDVVTSGRLIARVVPRPGAASIRPVGPWGERLLVVRDGVPDTSFSVGPLAVAIPCPRGEGLEELTLSFGDRAAPRGRSALGGYDLHLEYVIEVTRGIPDWVAPASFQGGVPCIGAAGFGLPSSFGSLPAGQATFCLPDPQLGNAFLELPHPIDPGSGPRCLADGCPETFLLQWPRTEAPLEVMLWMPADLSLTLLDDHGAVVAEAVAWSKEPRGDVPKQLSAPRLDPGRYWLHVEGPASAYFASFTPTGVGVADIGTDDLPPLNARRKGVIPVTIHSTPSFNAGSVDTSSLRLGPGGAAPVGESAADDVDADGDLDLVVAFPIRDVGAKPHDHYLGLFGQTAAGETFEAFDAVGTGR